MIYIFDIYTKHKRLWMNNYNFKEKQTNKGMYYRAKVTEDEKKEIIKKLRWSGLKYNIAEERWERSSNYRANFFKYYGEGPYRCRYCNKRLTKNTVVIDHVIPVSVAKKSGRARRKLKKKGIENVNDVRNLVASCKRCNSKKANKTGIWLYRAEWGAYNIYWVIRPIYHITIMVILYLYLEYMGITKMLYDIIAGLL